MDIRANLRRMLKLSKSAKDSSRYHETTLQKPVTVTGSLNTDQVPGEEPQTGKPEKPDTTEKPLPIPPSTNIHIPPDYADDTSVETLAEKSGDRRCSELTHADNRLEPRLDTTQTQPTFLIQVASPDVPDVDGEGPGKSYDNSVQASPIR